MVQVSSSPSPSSFTPDASTGPHALLDAEVTQADREIWVVGRVASAGVVQADDLRLVVVVRAVHGHRRADDGGRVARVVAVRKREAMRRSRGRL